MANLKNYYIYLMLFYLGLSDLTMSRDRANKRFYRVDSSHELRAYLDRGQAANQENRWTFEVAWEAANKGM